MIRRCQPAPGQPARSPFRRTDGMEPGVAIDPLINAQALAKVEAYACDAVNKGARVLVGGKRHGRGGLFFEPTVLANANPSMKITREETFGPTAPLYRFSDDWEAIGMANDTAYGMAAYFYSRDLGRIFRAAEALEYGFIPSNLTEAVCARSLIYKEAG